MKKDEIFKDIVNQYTAILYNRANYLLQDSDEAEDIVQDVFLSAYQGFDNYQGRSNTKTWLMGILKNKVADYYRKKYKQGTSISLSHFFDEDGTWKQDHALKEWRDDEKSLFDDLDFKRIFDHCIDRLPAKWSIPFKMYYLDNKKTDLLSQELGLSTTNIWKILQRGRLQLKECLEQNWFNK
ncbi:sigma-70 family RNA polymerase sigma factor [Sphingobacterium rhinopitheci]|uniref:sigma-70 family RNA polymerase sigma factor n=1 Tax=Sphingobacterium rhinopitheci TaxID=2781960 RepID=UPI001F516DAD|nr:sigma-70 family RNA polymerase sigma factor [Sphingobacterium rhinopitheci]MCI0921699.1 sigma-70 family RNA polymerase sigma factor [Sphingobacterium rhinopitheci]